MAQYLKISGIQDPGSMRGASVVASSGLQQEVGLVGTESVCWEGWREGYWC